ncbi:ATPase [Escherichia coli]
MLGGGIGKGDHASARWDDKAERVVFERKEPLQTRPSRSSRMPRRRPNAARRRWQRLAQKSASDAS